MNLAPDLSNLTQAADEEEDDDDNSGLLSKDDPNTEPEAFRALI